MKKILLLFFLTIYSSAFASTQIFCRARYLSEIYHPPVPPEYYYGSEIGSIPIAGTGSDGYYEKVWSNTFSLNLNFFSGYELNEYFNDNSFNDNSIVALVKWTNGGRSFITIESWTTGLKNITEDELKFTSTGERIYNITGYDDDGRYWEINI